LFIPTTPEELQQLGWSKLDVILVSGDTYIDSPYSGIAILGKHLLAAGYKVGVIAQPSVVDLSDITRLGEPALFWGVSGGAVDSMVANYTATLRKRRSDDFTPGGVNNRRPDRAVIVYSNLIRRAFKNTLPIVLGGIEASLRRITHYDYWDDRLRAPILFDAKANYLLYGMADNTILQLAALLRDGNDPQNLRGLSFLSHDAPADALILPSFEEVAADKAAFLGMFKTFYENNDPITARRIAQKKGDRYVIQNPPAETLTQAELDEIYAMPFERRQHPFYEKQGKARALETIQYSIPTHRGCYGECNFCAITVHEGRTVSWRSEASILSEASTMTQDPEFKGIIHDISGPTANMYAIECSKKLRSGACNDKRCLVPEICPAMKIDHARQIHLLKAIRSIPGVKKVFIGSGIRYDMVVSDRQHGREYLEQVARHHTSGQLKIAPEHSEASVLRLMGKPTPEALQEFKAQFDALSREAGKKQFLTYYLIAAYPGCTDADMERLHRYVSQQLKINPEQVQIFTPTPSTYASAMYYTGVDPFTGNTIYVEKNLTGKERQKEIVTGRQPGREPSPLQHTHNHQPHPKPGSSVKK
jgi:uncharacterized radical SAM protein YgiQ